MSRARPPGSDQLPGQQRAGQALPGRDRHTLGAGVVRRPGPNGRCGRNWLSGDAAAFAGKLRGAYITPTQYHSARTDLTTDAQNEYVLVTINRAVVDEAIQLTARHRLRGYDAVHLACTLILNRALVSRLLPPLVLVSTDVNPESSCG